MAFEALEVAIELCRELRQPLAELSRRDRSLADQARRAASGIALQVAEGRCRVGADRLHLYRIAWGSAEELTAALRVAEAWGYLPADDLGEARRLLDRQRALLWRLTH